MINLILFSFAFSAGMAAFFSPCSVVLLPGFITYYLSKKERRKSLLKTFLSGIWFGLIVILGFFSVFGIAGSLVLYIGNQVKAFIPLIGVVTGVLLVIIGFFILLGKDILLKLPNMPMKKDSSAYIFGIAYAVGALGCTFPLFVTVLVSGIGDSIFSGFVYLFAYILGMSVLMLATTILTAFGRDLVQKRINQIIPYIHKISAVIIILAGAYMIYYNGFINL